MTRRPGSRRATLPALVLALALSALAGCGDDEAGAGDTGDGGDASSSAAPDDEPVPSEDPAAEETGECTFLTAEAVAAALGTPAELTTAGPQTCFFDAADLTITVNQVPLAVDAQTYAEGSRDQCDGEITEVDVPDAVDAFACVAFAPQGFVFVDGASLVVQVDGAEDAAGVAAAASLLPEVTLG